MKNKCTEFILDYDMKISEPIHLGKGIVAQLDDWDYIGCDRIKKTIAVSEVGDCSMFIKKDLSYVKGFFIKTRTSKIFKAQDIMPTSSGSVVYFDEEVKGIFKDGCIYPVIMYKEYAWLFRSQNAFSKYFDDFYNIKILKNQLQVKHLINRRK